MTKKSGPRNLLRDFPSIPKPGILGSLNPGFTPVPGILIFFKNLPNPFPLPAVDAEGIAPVPVVTLLSKSLSLLKFLVNIFDPLLILGLKGLSLLRFLLTTLDP